jgi:hypothetical protein
MLIIFRPFKCQNYVAYFESLGHPKEIIIFATVLTPSKNMQAGDGKGVNNEPNH